MRVAILAHGQFPERTKVAVGVLRYGDDEVVAVLDRDRAGDRVRETVADAGGTVPDGLQDAPIVASMADAPACDALVIGIAPIGGGFADDWRPDVRTALERGCDVIAGLHDPLCGDEEFARLAAEHGCELRDVREPPADLDVAAGTAGDVDAHVVATVGTDCSVGKFTTTMELVEALRDAGHDAAAVPMGQTGVLVEGWGIAVDRAIADYVAGAAERLVERAAAEHDVLVVEGQGSLVHPAYSGVTCGLLHGAMPDALVLCHEAGRERIHGYESFALPPPGEVARRYESFVAPVHEASVVAGALNTAGVDASGADGTDDDSADGTDADGADGADGDRTDQHDGQRARAAVEEFAAAIGAPAVDPVRSGADRLVEPVLGTAGDESGCGDPRPADSKYP